MELGELSEPPYWMWDCWMCLTKPSVVPRILGLPKVQFLIACSMQKRSQKTWWILLRDGSVCKSNTNCLPDLLRTRFQHLKQCGQMKPYPKVFTQVLRSGFDLLGVEGWEASLPNSLASPQRDWLYHYIIGWIMHTNLFQCISIYTVASTTLH